MRITLIRHAQPLWIDNGEPTNDPILTDLGRQQAESVSARVTEWTVDELLVSPMRRCQQTIAPALETVDAPAETQPFLEEIRGPEWRDMSSDDIKTYWDRARARTPDEWWEGLPGGEDFRTFHSRVCSGMEAYLAERGITVGHDRLFEHFEDRRSVVIVAHAGTNSVLLGYLLGLAPVPWEWERFPMLHAAVTVIESDDVAGATTFQLRSFNDTSHLTREERTR